MRKRVMIIMAALLLAAVGAPSASIAVGLSGVYEAEFAGTPELEPELESEWEPEPQPEPESEPEPRPEPESEPEPEHEPESEAELESGEMAPETGQADLIPEDNAQEEQSEAEVTEAEESEAEEETPSEAEALEPEEFAARFSVFSEHEAVVESYAQLKSALADDNGITTVYFGKDITLQAGIKINPKKTDVVIVGLNPFEPGRTQPYTLTGIDSVSFVDTVYVSEAGTRSLYIRDLAIVGKNYYGTFSIADIIGLAGFVVTYERVSYDGPQLCHNRRGTVRFIDSSARIHGDNGDLSPRQEFSEAKHLIFEGANAIESVTSAYSIFWHPFGGTFEVAEDSSLVVTSPNTSATFGVFYANGYLNKLDIAVGSRSVFDLTISGAVAPEANITINSFTVREGGEFRLKTTKAATAAVLRVGGDLVVEKDAEFIINGAGGALQSLLRQQGGDITVKKDAVFRIIAENPYDTLLNLAGCGLVCDDPASVLLYNAGRDITASITAGRVYVNSQQDNYWDSTVPGGFDFPPLYGWRKADKSNFTIDGALNVGPGANFSKVSSNYADGDPPGMPPDLTTFDMKRSRVLAFGRLELMVAQPAENSTGVGGVTAAGALVRASLTQNGVDYTFPDVAADSNGSFHISFGVELEAGAVIKLQSSWQYLTAEAEVTVEGRGSLGLFAPDVLEFYTTPVSQFKKTIKRLNPNWKIVVADARGTGGKWSVYVKLGQEMLPESAHLPALNGSLIFVDDAGRASELDTDTETLIFEHTPSAGEDVFPIVWDEDKGILLDVRPGAVFVDTLYTADIHWTIVDGV